MYNIAQCTSCLKICCFFSRDISLNLYEDLSGYNRSRLISIVIIVLYVWLRLVQGRGGKPEQARIFARPLPNPCSHIGNDLIITKYDVNLLKITVIFYEYVFYRSGEITYFFNLATFSCASLCI